MNAKLEEERLQKEKEREALQAEFERKIAEL